MRVVSNAKRKQQSNTGMTLIEILITFVIVLVVLAAAYSLFKNITIKHKTIISKSSSQLQTNISLELLRKDIELAGFGLPWYLEGTLNSTNEPSKFFGSFDADPYYPRGIILGNGEGVNNSDVLIIKSSIANIDKKTSRKFGVLFYDGSWKVEQLGGKTFTSQDRCVVISPTTHAAYTYNTNYCTPCNSVPSDLTTSLSRYSVYLLFGITDNSCSFPYNRVDYFLKKPSDPNDFPERCNNATYIFLQSRG